jgi:hypothetical protein
MCGTALSKERGILALQGNWIVFSEARRLSMLRKIPISYKITLIKR